MLEIYLPLVCWNYFRHNFSQVVYLFELFLSCNDSRPHVDNSWTEDLKLKINLGWVNIKDCLHEEMILPLDTSTSPALFLRFFSKVLSHELFDKLDHFHLDGWKRLKFNLVCCNQKNNLLEVVQICLLLILLIPLSFLQGGDLAILLLQISFFLRHH